MECPLERRTRRTAERTVAMMGLVEEKRGESHSIAD
jgi:hypothetical protein